MPWNDQSGGGQQWRRPRSMGRRSAPSVGPAPPRQPQPPARPRPRRHVAPMARALRRRRRWRRWRHAPAAAAAVSWPLIAGVLVVGWLLTGVYTVDEGEQRRHHAPRRLQPHRRPRHPLPSAGADRSAPGDQRHRPAHRPRSASPRRDRDAITDNPDESLMITGDRNIVEIHFRIYYNIKDVVDFVFNVRDRREAAPCARSPKAPCAK